jgi:Protein kinase domain
MRPSAHLWVAATGLAAAAALAWIGVRPRPPPVEPLALRRAVDSRLADTAAALRVRVASLTRTPRLAAAVATDARTVLDLSEDELPLRPGPGEVIAVGQLSRKGGAPPIVLRVRPPDAEVPPLDAAAGPRALIVAGQLALSDAIRVRPFDRVDEVEGVVAASWRLPVGDLATAVSAAASTAWIETGRGVAMLAQSARPPRSRRIELPLESEAGRGLRLVLSVPAASPAPHLLGAGALALGSVLLSGRLWRRRVPRSDVRRTRSGQPLALPFGPATEAAEPASRREQRDVVGRYKLLKLIGVGGMAEVYLARSAGEAGFEKLVALKVLQPAFALQPQVVELLLDEARLASRLDHPNVVQILDLGRVEGQYFIAMEYIDGADLERLIGIGHRTHRPVPLAVALVILRRICDGLHAAHTATGSDGVPLGLVHRDVKSANVIVARTGVVKVGDFGIAKANHAIRASRTDIGIVKGTPGYMAPEQRLAQPLDGRTDVFGVGALAYELLSGTSVNLDVATTGHHGTAAWPHLRPLSELRPNLPPELEHIVLRALAFERQERFRSCAEMELALEAIAEAHPPVASEKRVANWVDDLLASDASATRTTARFVDHIR